MSKMKLTNNTSLLSERNICFVNSAVQLLYSARRMEIFFKQREYRLPPEKSRRMDICDEISRLFKADENYLSSASALRHLVALKSGKKYLNDGTQQDTIEFLTTMLQEVEREISPNNWEAKVVLQEFFGIENTEKKFLNKTNGACSLCSLSPRDEEEQFQVITLDVPDTSGVITLSQLIENYFTESSDDAKMKCNCCTHKINCPGTGACKPKSFSSKKVCVKSPDLLLLNLNRFKNCSDKKIKTTVWPNDKIQLQGDQFELSSIGHRIGDYPSSGHYQVTVKNGNEWIEYNDSNISKSSESNAKSMDCHVFFYTKVVTPHTTFTPTDEWQNVKGRKVPGGLHYKLGPNGIFARSLYPGTGPTIRAYSTLNVDRTKDREDSSLEQKDRPMRENKNPELNAAAKGSSIADGIDNMDEEWFTSKKRGFSRKKATDLCKEKRSVDEAGLKMEMASEKSKARKTNKKKDFSRYKAERTSERNKESE